MSGSNGPTAPERADDSSRVTRLTLPTDLLIRRPELGALAQPGVVLVLADLESA